MAAAAEAALEAQIERWPGALKIGEVTYTAAVTRTPSGGHQYLGGKLAEGTVTFRVRKSDLATPPAIGAKVEEGGVIHDVYEVSGDEAGWTIRAARRGSKGR